MIYIILIFAGLGILDAGYIYYKNSKPAPIACPLHSDCTAVLKSKYSKFLGVKNEIWGLLFYLFILLFFISLYFNTYFLSFLQYIVFISGFGVLYSLYLTYLQAFKIKDFCFYCALSAINTLIIFLLLLNL